MQSNIPGVIVLKKSEDVVEGNDDEVAGSKFEWERFAMPFLLLSFSWPQLWWQGMMIFTGKTRANVYFSETATIKSVLYSWRTTLLLNHFVSSSAGIVLTSINSPPYHTHLVAGEPQHLEKNKVSMISGSLKWLTRNFTFVPTGARLHQDRSKDTPKSSRRKLAVVDDWLKRWKSPFAQIMPGLADSAMISRNGVRRGPL